VLTRSQPEQSRHPIHSGWSGANTLWTVLRFLDGAPERTVLIIWFCVGPHQPPLYPWPGTVLSYFEPLHQGRDRASAATAGTATPSTSAAFRGASPCEPVRRWRKSGALIRLTSQILTQQRLRVFAIADNARKSIISHPMLLGREPINSKWSTDVRFGAHSGLKSDTTVVPKSANIGSL